MKNLHNKFIKNKLYLLLVLAWLGMSTTSCTTYVYYSPNGGSFSGPTGYCLGASSGPDSFNYTQCTAGSTSGFFVVPAGASGTAQWYYNTTGSTVPASSTALGSAVPFTSSAAGANGVITYNPLTTTTGTTYYFADMLWSGAGYCANEYITPAQAITVSPAVSPIVGVSSICNGTGTTFTDLTTLGTWSTDNTSVATISSSGVLTSEDSGTVNVDYTLGGCTVSSPLTILYAPPVPVVTPSVSTVCNGGNVMLTASVAPTLANLIPVNSFESGVPGTGWSESGGSTGYLEWETAGATFAPVVGAAEDGTYFLDWDAFNAPSGATANIYSPSFSLVGVTGVTITLWVWRDYNSPYAAGYGTEGFTFHINTTTAVGGTTLGFVPRDAQTAITGADISGPSTVTVSGWYEYTLTVPAAYAGYGTATNYFLVHCKSLYGEDCYLDNIAVQGYLPTIAPTWSPTTYLFSNSALTTPYVAGTPTDTVYVYPTGVTATTVETYTATETSATCPSTDTAMVTIYDPNATIAGTTSLCYGGNTAITFAGPVGATVSYNINGGSTLTTVIGAAGTSTVSTGTLYATTTYNLLGVVTGACSATLTGSAVVTVNPPTHTITGDSSVCIGTTNTLSNLPGGGTWVSVSTGVATIGSSSGIVGGILAGTSIITYTAPTSGCISTTTVTVNPLPTIFSITGGGTSSFCSGGLGIDLGLGGSSFGVSYQLYDNGIAMGTPLSGTGGTLTFGYQTFAGTYSVVGTNITTTCSDVMSGTAVIIINALPTVYTVGGGGAYCVGGSGYPITLSGSDTGVTYQVFDGSVAIGSSVAGTGAALNFGIFSAAGTYSIVATSNATGCSDYMSGSATIIVNPLPNVYNVTGGGAYCFDGPGVPVGLSNSQSGVNYQLYDGAAAIGTPAGGSGSAFNFGSETLAGTYTVVATTVLTGCVSDMNDSVVVIINPLPGVYTVTGSGSYCSGLGGLAVGINGSSLGISYQLYDGATAVGPALAGIGGSLSFGSIVPGGVYTVLATNTSTGCTNGMSGNATIVVNPLPAIYDVTGGGQYCADGTGVLVGLSGSQSGVNYQLFDGSIYETTTAGSGGVISFGLQVAAGTYTVFATNATTGCVNNMADSAVVIVNILIHDSVSLSTGYIDSVCTGTVVTYTATPVGGGSAPEYLWTVNGATVGGTGNTYTYTPLDSDNVTVTMTSSFPCGRPISPSYTTHMTVLPWEEPSLFIASVPVYSVCEGSPITISPTTTFAGGYSPDYIWIVNSTVEGTGPSYTYDPLNHDSVSCILVSDYQCRLADSVTSNIRIMHVDPLSVPSVVVYSKGGYLITIGTSDTLVALVTNGGTSPTYQWYIGTTPVPGANADTFISSTISNNDSISCLVTNSGLCAGIEAFNWVIINTGPLSVQQISTAGSDIRLMPNPNKGIFTVKGRWAIADNTDVTMEITDILGQVIYRSTGKTQQGEMNETITLGNAPANGVYLLNIQRGAENKVFHFVIEQ